MPRAASGGRARPPIQSAARAAGLLQQLAVLGRPASLAELAASSGLERSTAWRLLTTLEACGLVDRESSSDGFRVGFGTVAIASAALSDGAALASRVRPELRRLCVATGEAAAVSLVRGTRVLVVDQVDPPSVVSVSWVGREFRQRPAPRALMIVRFSAGRLPAPTARVNHLRHRAWRGVAAGGSGRWGCVPRRTVQARRLARSAIQNQD